MNALSIELIRRELVTETVAVHMHLFGTVSSTNAALRRLAREGAPEGTVVLAETQTSGHGRLGKEWFSPPGVNLYASVLFRPHIAPAAVPMFAFIASVALAEAICAEGVHAGIKWPNDVLIGARKVGGVLVESSIIGGAVAYVILGVGVNLNVTPAALREALGQAGHAATSLAAAAGREIDRNRFAATLLNRLEKWHGEYMAHGPESVLAAWRDREVLTGRRVEVREGSETYDGRVLGLDRDGYLMVRGSSGETLSRVLAGEVRVLD